MVRVVEGKGAGSGYLWAALHGHTRLLKSSGRDHAESLEVRPRTGWQRTGWQRTGASGARAPSPPAGVGRWGAAVPGPAGRGLRPEPAVDSPNGGSRGGASAPSALPPSPLRRLVAARVRRERGEGLGEGGWRDGAVTLSRGGGLAFLASRPAGSGSVALRAGRARPDNPRPAARTGPGAWQAAPRVFPHLSRQWPGPGRCPDICALRGSSVS